MPFFLPPLAHQAMHSIGVEVFGNSRSRLEVHGYRSVQAGWGRHMVRAVRPSLDRGGGGGRACLGMALTTPYIRLLLPLRALEKTQRGCPVDGLMVTTSVAEEDGLEQVSRQAVDGVRAWKMLLGVDTSTEDE